MNNSLVTPMFYNQNGQKVNLENWMQNLETQWSTFQTNLTNNNTTFQTNLTNNNTTFQTNLTNNNTTFQTDLTNSVNTKIENLVTLNGVKNSSPKFWAPTTEGKAWQVPCIDNRGDMGWVDLPTHSKYYSYGLPPSSSSFNKITFSVPNEGGVYIIFMWVLNHETGVSYLGLGLAGEDDCSKDDCSNALVVVDGQDFFITRNNTEVTVEGPSTKTTDGRDFKYDLLRCAWLRLS